MFIDDPIDDESTVEMAEKWERLIKASPPIRGAYVSVSIRPGEGGVLGLSYTYSFSRDGMAISGSGTPQNFDTISEAIAMAIEYLRMAGPKEKP